MGRVAIIPRLLNRDEAADYVGMSRAAFERHCSVKPIEFGDARLQRFDREDLDAWIEARKLPDPAKGQVKNQNDMARDLESFDG